MTTSYKVSKAKQMQELESNPQAQAIINGGLIKEKQDEAPAKEKISKSQKKKYYSFYLDISLIDEIKDFINEYGKPKETQNSFIIEALRYFIDYRKGKLKEELEQKLKSFK